MSPVVTASPVVVIARSEATKQSRKLRVVLDCFAALAMTLSAPSRRDAAVDGEDHARGVAASVGSEEGHEVADLAGMRGAAERQSLLEFLVAVLVAELVFCPRLEQRHMAVGADR